MSRDLTLSITRAEAFLVDRQLGSGEFATYRFEDSALQSEAIYDPSPFATTFVLSALAALDSPRSAPACDSAIQYLLAQREDPGLWRYWSKENTATIDPDVDVTCCAATVIRRLAPESHTPAADPAILSNRVLRGLFKTWFRPGHASNDIALGVNANALLYFGETEETRRVVDHINVVVNAGKEEGSDWYYPEPMTVRYLISRAYHSGVQRLADCKESIVRRTHEQWASHGTYGNSLATALSISTLINCGDPDTSYIAPAAHDLIQAQREDGSWPAHAFYAGPEPPGPHAYWWGSEELTTALVLEALSRFRETEAY